jgi:hypothetical protein
MKNLSRGMIVGLLMSSTLSIGAATYVSGAYPVSGVAEGITNANITLLGATINLQLSQYFNMPKTGLIDSMTDQFQQLTSAIEVATAQEAIGANQISKAINATGESVANTMASVNASSAVKQIIVQNSPATGQGYQPCGTMSKNQTLDKAFTNGHGRALRVSYDQKIGPGSFVNSVQDYNRNIVDAHLKKFCTPPEAAAGLCVMSDQVELRGADSNGALLFTPVHGKSDLQEARDLYVQRVIGAPDAMPPREATNTPAGDAYQFSVNRKQSFQSIPAYSLRVIQEANTRQDAYGGKSPNEILKLRVNEYFGGKEALSWSKVLATQDQAGLLRENVRMGGMEAWMRLQQLKQLDRINLNLAAMVLLEAEAEKPRGEAAGNINSARSAVK